MNIKTNEEYLKDFINTKRLEGCSDKTCANYTFNLKKFLESIGDKNLTEITTTDIRNHLANYKEVRKVSNCTLNNMRRVISSFYTFMHNEGAVQNNPCAAVNRIKANQVIKMPYSEEELEILRDNCKDIREQAIIEVLYCSGMRVSELAALNKNDIDWKENKAVVFGKGSKEREVYFSIKAKMLLKKYLDTRKDDNEALFVYLRPPYKRLNNSGYEEILKKIGNRCGIHCYPHRFRRTCATTLLNKGMPVQEVSKILGHAKLETTMIYCNINQKSVQNNFSKFMN